jgi:glycosyltransferase involved in cell wall biosynthesis
VPLVLDFRDSWVNNPYHNFKGWRLQYETFLEAFCLKQAVAVVSVTEPIVEEFRLKCSPSKRVLNITNGFTIEPDLKLSTAPSDGFFRLVYTGLFYGNRTPEYFFTGLKRASELNPALLTHLKVIIAGKMPATYLEELRQFPLREMVDFRGFLPHSEVLEILSSANVLLLIQSDDDKGFYSSKLFEYLSVRKFILALAPFDGIAGQLIAKLCAGKVVQHNDIEAITKNILELYDAFSQGKIEAKHTLQDIWEFSWPGLADKYANLLNEIDSNRGCDNPAN